MSTVTISTRRHRWRAALLLVAALVCLALAVVGAITGHPVEAALVALLVVAIVQQVQIAALERSARVVRRVESRPAGHVWAAPIPDPIDVAEAFAREVDHLVLPPGRVETVMVKTRNGPRPLQVVQPVSRVPRSVSGALVSPDRGVWPDGPVR